MQQLTPNASYLINLKCPAKKDTHHVMILMFSLAGVYKSGIANAGDVLFTSWSNQVEVFFETNAAVTLPGFTLDVRSTAC